MKRLFPSICAVLMAAGTAVFAQSAGRSTSAVPRLMNYSGTLTDAAGLPIRGAAGVTFAIYEEHEGGSPIWMETQNIQADENGKYTALLGATRNEGIPAEVFGAGQRWLGVRVQGVQGEIERPRVLLTSVPYSLKAVDAETLGGLPASAFALAGTAGRASASSSAEAGKPTGASGAARSDAAPAAGVTGSGTAGTVPVWTGASTLGNSVILQSSGNVGIGRVSTGAAFLAESPTEAGIAGSTGSTTGVGVQGQALGTTGTTSGVVGLSASTSGTGVEGEATATSGQTSAVLGVATSTSGFGVVGKESSASGETYGVYGTVVSTSGTAVEGEATATTGSTVGVYGTVASDAGYAIWGDASATSGTTIGVYGQNESETGYGVEGQATATTGATVGVYGKSVSNDGFGVEGQATATSGETLGVLGISLSTVGIGVEGQANATTGKNTGVGGVSASTSGIGTAGYVTATSGNTVGVQGQSDSTSGVGVFGVGAIFSTIGSDQVGNQAGVWGDTHAGFAGVLATADDAQAVVAYNNAENVATMFVENQTDSNGSANVFATYSDFGGYCDINVSGDLTCSGSVGGHAFVGPNASKEVSVYAMQSPENWFEDVGSGQLHSGMAAVAFEAEYAQTVNAGVEYHVFLTPKGDCKGLYVTNETASGFEVRELGGGASSIAFDYRIVARRKGYENVRMADLTGKIQRGPHARNAALSAHETGAEVLRRPRIVTPASDTARNAQAAKPRARAAKLPAQAAKPALEIR